MILTQAGERLLTSAQLVLEELERAELDIRQTATSQQGILRIATECNTCYHWLPQTLKLFQQNHPLVEVRIVVEATNRPLPVMLEGKLDLAIVHETMRNRRLQYGKLFRDELLVIMPPEHKLAPRSLITAEDFIDETLIFYAVPSEETLLFTEVLIPAGVRPKRVLQVQLTEAIIEMVRAGLGIGVMARWAVAPYLANGSLRGVRLTTRGLFRQWWVATLRSKITPPYLNDFIKLLSVGSNAMIGSSQKIRVAS
jgi:LysR family transcriptional regulator for metE and metH